MLRYACAITNAIANSEFLNVNRLLSNITTYLRLSNHHILLFP